MSKKRVSSLVDITYRKIGPATNNLSGCTPKKSEERRRIVTDQIGLKGRQVVYRPAYVLMVYLTQAVTGAT
jgi:hypothetical protein